MTTTSPALISRLPSYNGHSVQMPARLPSGGNGPSGNAVSLDPNAIDVSSIPRSLGAPQFDVSDPDSLFAFFSAQMTEAKGNLTSMMTKQQQRNEQVRELQAAVAKFAQFESSGVDASNATAFAQMHAAALALVATLPPGTEANTIKGILNGVSPGGQQTKTFARLEDAKVEGFAHDRAEVDGVDAKSPLLDTHLQGKNGPFTVTWSEAGKGLTTDEVKTITSSVKALTDGLQTDSSMEMIRIQQGVERMTQISNLCSNILKKQNDAQENVVSNLR